MPRNIRLLFVVAILLAAGGGLFFTGWFRPQTIRIFHTSRNLRPHFSRGASQPNLMLMFGLDRQVRLTEIKVVLCSAFQTNAGTLPLWHLVSDSNSVPVKTFFYGQIIRGLKPAVPGTHARPLTNDVTYRLLVTAGKIKGEHDFELK